MTNINNKPPITGIAGVICSARKGQLEKKEDSRSGIRFLPFFSPDERARVLNKLSQDTGLVTDVLSALKVSRNAV